MAAYGGVMVDGRSYLGKRRGSYRARIGAALLILAIAAGICWALASQRAAHVAPRPRTGAHQGLLTLPQGAQGPVSAAVGRVDAAYRVHYAPGSLTAFSPAQRLRSRFSRSGASVSTGSTRLEMRLSAVGYGSALSAVDAATPRRTANRVVYAHQGVDEWYLNGPLGLEQGFTLAQAPARKGSGPLTLAIAIAGNAHGSLTRGATGVNFLAAGSSKLRYTGLAAADATGRPLRSWLSLADGQLLLHVDTSGARFPVRIDPFVQAGEKLAGSGESGSGELGYSVALSGDGSTALVGAPADGGGSFPTGAAWIFTRSGSTWTQQGSKLTGSGGEPSGFGWSVALSANGNTALIGALHSGPNYNGAAYVFTRSGTAWAQQGGALTDSGNTEETELGSSVALSADGNTALIGGLNHNGNTGAAYVFTRTGSAWAQQGGTLEGGGESGEAEFGASAALSADGNTALIGGPSDNGTEGAAWVFTRTGSSWSQQGSKLSGGDGEFGDSVALSASGDEALIGARSEPSPERDGAAYVYSRTGSTWTQQDKLTLGGKAPGDHFGSAVALSADGNDALIGAPGQNGSKGAAWQFVLSGGKGTQGEELTGEGESGSAEFGSSIGVSENYEDALVGGAADNGRTGAMWAFDRPVTVPATEVSTALFVAGDVARLSGAREGTLELILEKALQQLYADEPSLPASEAEGYIDEMKALLASPSAPTKASLQVMAGNQRVIAILAALEAPYGKPAKQLAKAAKLAVTHLAAVALASSSNVFANAESPKYFEPLADERSNLLYSSFAPATVLRASRELAKRNPMFGQARDNLWKSASEESVFSEWHQLFEESKDVLHGPALSGLRKEIEAGDGALDKTPKQLVELFSAGQRTTQEQTCEHNGTEEELGTGQPEGGRTIPGVPRLKCSGGALYEASRAKHESGETLTEVQLKAKEHEEIIRQQQAVMISAAELLHPSEEKSAEVLAATSQAQTQITEAEQKWAKFEAEQKVRNNVRNSLEIIYSFGASVASLATGNETEGASGMVGVIFKIYGLIEENVVEQPENPEEFTLKDIGLLRTQLAGFQQYTQEAFRALNVQISQLTAQLAQDNYELTLELHSLTERLESEQQTIFVLQNEVQTLFSTQTKAELQTTIADSVGWLRRTHEVLPSSKLQESLVGLDKYATEIANGALVNKELQPFTFEGADNQLTSKKNGEPEELNESISYLTHFPSEREWSSGSVPASIANTTFWSEGARAYGQLMLENPSHVSEPDVAALKGLEAEGVTLTKAQALWAQHSGGDKTGNAVIDHALQGVEQAAAGHGVDGKRSITEVLEEAAVKPFVNGFTGTEVADNPTGATPFMDVSSIISLEEKKIEEAKYPVLAPVESNNEVECLPAPLLDGVRLGLVGKKGSGDEWEVAFTPGEQLPSFECPKVEVFAKETKALTYETAQEGEPWFPASALARGLMRLHKEAYEEDLVALKTEIAPAEQLAGARALVQSYVRLGLPQAPPTDLLVQADIEGIGAQFLDPEPGSPRAVPEELSALVASWTRRLEEGLNFPHVHALEVLKETEEADKATYEKDLSEESSLRCMHAPLACQHATDTAQKAYEAAKQSYEEEKAHLESEISTLPFTNLIGEVGKRSSAWVEQVSEGLKPYVADEVKGFAEKNEAEGLSEQSALIESTINRLRLTRDLLDESKAPTAETLAPTGLGLTEATVNGEVNSYSEEIESCKFEYGSSEAYGTSVPCETIPLASDESSVVSAKVTEWTKGGGFHERLVVRTWGGTTYGQDVKVQLSESGTGGGNGAPTVVTGEVTRIKKRGALLHGTVNPNGEAVAKCWATIQEEEGKHETLSFSCIGGVGTGHAPTQVLVNGRKLLPGTKYVYRLHAENIVGAQGEGAPEKFETLRKPVKKH